MVITLKGELYSKKNSKKIVKSSSKFYYETHNFISNEGLKKEINVKRPMNLILSSNKSIKAEVDLVKQMNLLRKEWENESAGKEYPLKIEVYLFRKTDRIFDYINIVQGLFDAMTKAKWIPDDNIKYVIPVFKGWEKDSKNPRTEVKII